MYGIHGSILSWISDFLSEHTQRGLVDDAVSDSVAVTSDVPQVSVLGPILFLCYINDLPDQITICCRLFADDSVLYRQINTTVDSDALQKDLDALAAWEGRSGMQYHPDKLVCGSQDHPAAPSPGH